MDSQATPPKASREYADGLSTPGPGVGSAMMNILSPDPACTFSLARQHPPAIASKPRSSRKVCNFFSGSDAGETAGFNGAPDIKHFVDSGDRLPTTTARDGLYCASSPVKGPSGGGGRDNSNGGAGFTSPARTSGTSGTASSRFTPQRNLGGLFASPLPAPPQTRDENCGVIAAPSPVPAGAAASLTADAVPLLLRWPERQEADADAFTCSNAVDEASPARSKPHEAAKAESPAPAAVSSRAAGAPEWYRADSAGPTTPSPVAIPAAATTSAAAVAPTGLKRAENVCRCGCSSAGVTDADSSSGELCCVSNEAFKDGTAMRTLEVLVKRERVGVSALASWRVAELKRRLVHLRFFPAADGITLVPTFPLGGAALEDDVLLDTLDADATLRARRSTVAAM